MTVRIPASVLLLSLFSLSPAALPQTAAIAGTVMDTTAAVVPQAKVAARHLATNVVRSAVTDGSGNYRITSLVPGIYDVLAERSRFNPVEHSRLQLTLGHV